MTYEPESCEDCPLGNYHEVTLSVLSCNHPLAHRRRLRVVTSASKVPEGCPLRTEPLYVELEEDR